MVVGLDQIGGCLHAVYKQFPVRVEDDFRSRFLTGSDPCAVGILRGAFRQAARQNDNIALPDFGQQLREQTVQDFPGHGDAGLV